MTFTREDQFDVPAYLDELLNKNSNGIPLTEKLTTRAAKYLGNWDQAQDVVQDVMIHLLDGGIKHYDPSQSFMGWITTVTRNRCMDELRKRNRMHKQPILDTDNKNVLNYLPSRETGPLQKLVMAEEAKLVPKSLESLPQKYRQPVLYYAAGLTYNDIADLLNIPEGTVKSRISVGRKKLQKDSTRD